MTILGTLALGNPTNPVTSRPPGGGHGSGCIHNMEKPNPFEVTQPMTAEQFAALMAALNDLADECGRAYAQARIERADAPHLIGLVRQVRLFLRPPDGLEPLAAVWPMGRRDLFTPH